MDEFRRRMPRYPDDSDYKTNAPSYYEDLARKNKLIQFLAEKIEIHLDEAEKVLNAVIEKIGEGFNTEIADLLVQWVADGTLDHIINETLMNQKADKDVVDTIKKDLFKKIMDTKEILTTEISHFFVSTNSLGIYGDGVTDNTVDLQNMFDTYKNIYFSAGTYMINPKTGINVHDNMYIKFDKNAKIKAMSHNETHYEMFRVWYSENVTFDSVVIDGSRKNNSAVTGEWGMGIDLRGTKNILIKDCVIENTWGDGIFIDKHNGRHATNTTIVNSRFKNSRRQGISVISAKVLLIDNCIFEDIRGTSPEAGIDLEPNFNDEFLEQIVINNVVTKNCGIGIVVNPMNLLGGYNTISVQINNHNDYGSDRGVVVSENYDNVKGMIVFNNSVLKRNKRNAIHIRNSGSNGATIIFNNTLIDEYKVGHTKHADDLLNTVITIHKEKDDINKTSHLGGISLNNLSIINSGEYTFAGVHVVNNKDPLKVKKINIIDPLTLDSRINLFASETMVTDKFLILTKETANETLLEGANLVTTLTNTNNTGSVLFSLSSTFPNGTVVTIINKNNSNNSLVLKLLGGQTFAYFNNANEIFSKKFGSRIRIIKNNNQWEVLNILGEWDSRI